MELLIKELYLEFSSLVYFFLFDVSLACILSWRLVYQNDFFLVGNSICFGEGTQTHTSKEFHLFMQAVGSIMTNKYSEGYLGVGYYGGNECEMLSPPLSSLTFHAFCCLCNIHSVSACPSQDIKCSLRFVLSFRISINYDINHGCILPAHWHGWTLRRKRAWSFSLNPAKWGGNSYMLFIFLSGRENVQLEIQLWTQSKPEWPKGRQDGLWLQATQPNLDPDNVLW